MSLFDYIKYQGTDVCSLEQIQTLPRGLVELLYLKIIEHLYECNPPLRQKGATSPNKVEYFELCRSITWWAEDRIELTRSIYTKALKEYCDEPF